jgi:hypothetical protein
MKEYLRDWLSDPQRNRVRSEVDKLQGDLAVKSGVDPTRGAMHEQTQSCKRRLPLHLRPEIRRKRHALGSRSQEELTGVQVNHGIFGQRYVQTIRLDERGIQSQVNGCGLNQIVTARLQSQFAGSDTQTYVSVTK